MASHDHSSFIKITEHDFAQHKRGRPSFLILENDFSTPLQFPQRFVSWHGDELPENAKIRANSGETWNVHLERMEGDNSCFFTRGWSEFAHDFDLKFGEFVVFWFDVENSTFEVDVFGVNGVAREYSDDSSSIVTQV